MLKSKKEVVEEAYQHISNSGFTYRVEKITCEKYGYNYNMLIKINAFGHGTEFKFPLSKGFIDWCADVFPRLSKTMEEKEYNDPFLDNFLNEKIRIRTKDGQMIPDQRKWVSFESADGKVAGGCLVDEDLHKDRASKAI